MKLHLVDATFELFRAFYSPGRQMEFAPDGRLFITENTAANHVRSILAKTGAKNRTQAARYAIDHGLLL